MCYFRLYTISGEYRFRSFSGGPATLVVLLDRWTRNIAIRTKYTTVSGFWPQQLTAEEALVEELTGILRHFFSCSPTALWTGQRGKTFNHFAHNQMRKVFLFTPGDPPDCGQHIGCFRPLPVVGVEISILYYAIGIDDKSHRQGQFHRNGMNAYFFLLLLSFLNVCLKLFASSLNI